MTGRPVGTSQFRPDIEGLRAIAVLMVLAFHAGIPFVPGGFAGVDVFFVISGFLITGLLVREIERSGRVSLLSFYGRRAKRLLPAASLVLVVTGVLSWLFIPRVRWAEIGGDLVGSAVYLINWRLADRSVDYLAEDSIASPVQHYWSLAVEEQFYIVWPLLMVLGAWLIRRHRLRTRPVLALLLVMVVVASLTWSVVATGSQPVTAYFVTTTRLWQLGSGGLVALTTAYWQRLAPSLATALAWAGLLALVLTGLLLGTGTAWPGYAALLPTLGTAAVIAGGFAGRAGGPIRLLGAAPMLSIGATSYSLYLWHWPLLVAAAAAWGDLALWQGVLIAAFSYVPARLTYLFVENPIRIAPILSRLPSMALVMGAVCTVLGVGAGLSLVRGMESSIVQAEGSAQGAGELLGGDDAATTGADDEEENGGQQSTEDPSESPSPSPSASSDSSTETPGPDPSTAGPDVSKLDLTPESISPDPLLAIQDIPSLYSRDCAGSVGSTAVIRCDGGDLDGDLVVAIVGDSKIGQWGDVLEQIGQDEGWQVRLYNRSGCPWSAAAQVDEDGSCHRWGEQVHDRLLGAEPPDVVLVSGVRSGAGDESDPQRLDRMAQGYADYWSDLGDAGVPVVALADTPNPGGLSVYECVSEHRDDVSECTFNRNDGSGTPALAAAVELVPTSTLLSMNDWICPLQDCPPVIGDVLVYRQGSHITNTYAKSLLEPLRARLVPAVERAMATLEPASGAH